MAQHGESLRVDLIAALYVEKGGVYYGLPDVDPWDEERDARNYAGPWPVVAHPPCNRWVSYGAQTLRGQDDGCFAAALAAVRKWGGVLEHPARSQAWRAFGLPRPLGQNQWIKRLDDPGWACEVDQALWGFPTSKRTWLYFVGESPPQLPDRLAPSLPGCDRLWSTKRSKTPPAFRDALLSLAPNPPTRSEHSLEGTAVNGPMPMGERESSR